VGSESGKGKTTSLKLQWVCSDSTAVHVQVQLELGATESGRGGGLCWVNSAGIRARPGDPSLAIPRSRHGLPCGPPWSSTRPSGLVQRRRRLHIDSEPKLGRVLNEPSLPRACASALTTPSPAESPAASRPVSPAAASAEHAAGQRRKLSLGDQAARRLSLSESASEHTSVAATYTVAEIATTSLLKRGRRRSS
jgi:hypothetical protein